MIKKLLSPLSSLKLTVILIIAAMLLVYVGTWAQVDSGSWQVQKKYFHSFLTWVDLQTLIPRQYHLPGGFPMLGGYTIGLLMLINLIAAHAIRFKLSAKRTGIILIHFGVILLLLGEGLTSGLAVESQMVIDEGASVSYSQDIRESELAITDTSPSAHDSITIIPDKKLLPGNTISDPLLPFNIKVDAYYPNSVRSKRRPQGAPRATKGEGIHWSVVERGPFSGAGTDAGRVDAPSGFVTLTTREGANLGTYLVSLHMDHPQEVQLAGKTYLLELRFNRLYKPYSVHLIDFAHDRYTGTDVPKNYSSRVRFIDPTHDYNREILIWMNHPFRYRGETFYQADFRNNDQTTVLQVVNNPGWLMPYFACIIGAIGLIVHFGIKLTDFIRRKFKAMAAEESVLVQVPPQRKNGKNEYVLLPRPLLMRATFLLPAAIVGIMLIYFASAIMRNAAPTEPFDLQAFGKLPISFEGRTQPLDSLARNSLRIMSGSETIYINKESQPPIKMLADILTHQSDDYKLFRVGHVEVLNVMNLDETQKKYSIRELAVAGEKFDEQFAIAAKIRKADARKLDSYQKNILELGENLSLYRRLGDLGALFLLPPLKEGEEWKPLSTAVSKTGQTSHPAAEAWVNILQSYHENRPTDFNREVKEYQKLLDAQLPSAMNKVRLETTFNTIEPFMRCIELYLLAYILVSLAWVFYTGPLSRASIWVIALAFLIHTVALIGRMYISGRPPVTNLYSSAIFIPWGIVVLGMGLEYFYRNGVGLAAASVAGFLSMVIAQNLAADGDTMKMLQAVLDTNFWLATHVVIVTLGYAATFLAGLLGIIYVLKGVLGTTMTKEESKDIGRMIYGIICFAILFSFVGTILGGIWADQSWGRFWGWDPKENGAVLIVLWNALVLHARWAGLVRERGLAALAIGGNIVTSWSWFGTNMLGVGLHSYGFMDSALLWLLMFVGTQLALITVANIPLEHWRSPLLEMSAEKSRPAKGRMPVGVKSGVGDRISCG
jgi:ABC-type transport system involved in cytochrome c biogenesis permease subunit